MRKAFLDTNVVIDFLGERPAYFHDAATIVCRAETGDLELQCSSLTYSNAAYILRHGFSFEEIRTKLTLFAELCQITTVDAETVSQALASNYRDLEDAMQYYSAKASHADCIVTRNVKDFLSTDIPIMTPAEFLQTL